MPFISHFKDDRNTSRATDRSLEGPSVFIELNFDYNTQKTAKPSTCPASITITPTIQKEKEATESMGPALDTAERGERLLQNTLGRTDHYSDIPGYKNFTRMEPAFFYLIEERITHTHTPLSGSQSPTSGSHWKSA